jgi:ATP-dependent Clp protease ATP-binding subunit ClpB
VAELRYGHIKNTEQKIDQLKEKLKAMQGDEALIKEEVTPEDIAEVVSRWTRIPVSKIVTNRKGQISSSGN